jgi:hypothetical protein
LLPKTLHFKLVETGCYKCFYNRDMTCLRSNVQSFIIVVSISAMREKEFNNLKVPMLCSTTQWRCRFAIV